MRELTCIICPNSCTLNVEETPMSVSGNLCPRGVQFARQELTDPRRTLTTTIRTADVRKPVLPVKTDGEISKSLIRQAMEEMHRTVIDHPVRAGDIIIEDLCGSGIPVIACAECAGGKQHE